MLCYESVVKNVMEVVLFYLFIYLFIIPLFLDVIGSSMIFYYFILAYKELTPQQL